MADNIVIPIPQTVTKRNPVSVKLSKEQVAGLVAALAAAGVTLPQDISQISINVLPDASANVRISFLDASLQRPLTA